jgi:transposase
VRGAILPKSKFKEALCYFSSLVPHLKNYTRHSEARLDNNPTKRAIRPLAIGRKNWLFVGSEESGEAAATLLSLTQTCRALKIHPQVYMEDVCRRIMGHSRSRHTNYSLMGG